MSTQENDLSPEYSAEEIIELIENTGMAYAHSSGCVVLKDGTWLQPEQWQVWVEYLKSEEREAC